MNCPFDKEFEWEYTKIFVQKFEKLLELTLIVISVIFGMSKQFESLSTRFDKPIHSLPVIFKLIKFCFETLCTTDKKTKSKNLKKKIYLKLQWIIVYLSNLCSEKLDKKKVVSRIVQVTWSHNSRITKEICWFLNSSLCSSCITPGQCSPI